MSPHHAWTILLLFVVTLAPASASQERLRDELITVLQSDAEVHSAIARAREGLAAFWEVFSPRKNREAGLVHDARSNKGERTGHLLASLLQPKAGKTVPVTSDHLRSVLGEWSAVEVGEWLQSGEPMGTVGYAVPPSFRQPPFAEVEWYRQLLAEP